MEDLHIDGMQSLCDKGLREVSRLWVACNEHIWQFAKVAKDNAMGKKCFVGIADKVRLEGASFHGWQGCHLPLASASAAFINPAGGSENGCNARIDDG